MSHYKFKDVELPPELKRMRDELLYVRNKLPSVLAKKQVSRKEAVSILANFFFYNHKYYEHCVGLERILLKNPMTYAGWFVGILEDILPEIPKINTPNKKALEAYYNKVLSDYQALKYSRKNDSYMQVLHKLFGKTKKSCKKKSSKKNKRR